jgi:putative membrane protein
MHLNLAEGDEMKTVLSALCCLVLFSLPALAQKKAAAAPMTDQEFVDFAAQTDMVEANLGQLGQDVASSPAVKDYGKMLVTDHTADYQKLQSMATQAGLTVPTAIDAKNNKAMIGPFHALKGAAFDHKYIAEMVSGHTKALAIYNKEADDAKDAAIKTYAQDAIPVLEKHLQDAKALEQGKTPSGL